MHNVDTYVRNPPTRLLLLLTLVFVSVILDRVHYTHVTLINSHFLAILTNYLLYLSLIFSGNTVLTETNKHRKWFTSCTK